MIPFVFLADFTLAISSLQPAAPTQAVMPSSLNAETAIIESAPPTTLGKAPPPQLGQGPSSLVQEPK